MPIDDVIIIYSHKYGSNQTVAENISHIFGVKCVCVLDQPDLADYAIIIVIASNFGDEELHPNLEDFLSKQTITNKKYIVCELGNYFGYERDCFGCKKIVRNICKSLNWEEINDISIDSFPNFDDRTFNFWISNLNGSIND